MTSRLRHQCPRAGREHFDRRAGREWVEGPFEDVANSLPDTPWRDYARIMRGRSAILFSNDRWAVTADYIEPLHSGNVTAFAPFKIAVEDLLKTQKGILYWPERVALGLDWEYWTAFEEVFREALRLHSRERHLTYEEAFIAQSFLMANTIATSRR